MRRLFPLLLLLAGMGGPIPAETNPCPAYLADLTFAERMELVARTYVRLLETLGGSLTAEETAGLAEGDPFATFESPHVPAPLRRPLRQFTELVSKKGWRDPATLEQVRTAIRQHAVAKQRAVETIRHAILRADPIHDVTFPHHWEAAIHPHENLILVNVRVGAKESDLQPLVLYDVDRRTFNELPGTAVPLTGITFSRDGKEVYAATHYQVWRVPFRDRVARWDEARRIGDPIPDRSNVAMRIEESPAENRLYVAASFLARPEHFVDLATNRRTAIDVSALEQQGIHILSWGTIPGTAQLYVTGLDGKTRRLYRVQVTDDGVARTLNGDWELEDSPTQLLSGGKSILVQTSKWVDIHTEGQNRQMFVDHSIMSNAAVRAAAVNADESKLAILIREANDTLHVEWYDVASGKWIGQIPLPRRSGYGHLRFLPNDQLLISGTDRATVTIAESPSP